MPVVLSAIRSKRKGKTIMPENEKRSIIQEFKEFISRGNVMDLAVGIIIGAAFTAIVNSVVNDLITPLMGVLIGGINFSSLKITLPSLHPDVQPPVFAYGAFIQAAINFLVIAVCVFLLIKSINTLKNRMEREKKAAEEAAAPAPEKAADVVLLEEIRDLLKQRNNEK